MAAVCGGGTWRQIPTLLRRPHLVALSADAASPNRDKWHRNLYFYPGRHSGVGHYEDPQPPRSWAWATTYWNNAVGRCSSNGRCSIDAFRYDFALIRMAKRVGDAYGWFSVGSHGCKTKGYKTMTTIG